MPEVVTTVGIFLSYVPGANWLGLALIVIGSIWGGEEAKKKRKEKEEEARRAYNNALQDRTATTMSAESPHVYVYGRARVGSSIVAVLTSGARDEFKHIVCVHAAHECDAIEEVYINGRALGALDGSGYVTGGYYYTETTTQASSGVFYGTGITLAHVPDAGSVRIFRTGDPDPVPYNGSYTLVGAVISGLLVGNYMVNYAYSTADNRVRCRKFLGSPSQVADSATIAEVPSKWNSSCILRGLCYTIIRLDLNFAEFQSGVPTVEVLLRGKKLYDPRNGLTQWSQNPALMVRDYLTSELCGVPASDIPEAEYIAAANVCDESTAYGAKYTANGTVTAAQSQSQVLEKMAQCMAGSIVSTTWGINAGKYVAPVKALSQSDVVGALSYTSGVADSELYNGVKGQYISAENLYVATDFAPYQNAAYVTADGGELWTDIAFMFTDTKQRVHNLCRIYVEDQRNGFTIVGDFSYKCWALQVGQRVTFTSSLLGFTDKVFRIINKTYSPESAVRITMKEDNAAIWDLADAVSADSVQQGTLQTNLAVSPIGNLQASEALYETNGSTGVKVRVSLTWSAPVDAFVLVYDVSYRKISDVNYTEVPRTAATAYDLFDMEAGTYDFRVRAVNNLGAVSEYVVLTKEVYGLLALPADVTGFSVKPFNGAALASWDRTVDLDVKVGGDVVIRFCPLTVGAAWEKSVTLPDGKYNGDATSAIVSLGTGTYFAKFVDSTGSYSATPAEFIATEALMTGWTTVLTSTQHPAFSGVKTNTVAIDGILKLVGADLFDTFAALDTVGNIDNVGGSVASGTYDFDAVVDMTTVASRRFAAHIAALSYAADDYIDSRLSSVDDWVMFDGGAINDTDAVVEIATSNDNVTYTAFVPFKVADFNCRYAKFRLELTRQNNMNNIAVSELSVAVKIPA